MLASHGPDVWLQCCCHKGQDSRIDPVCFGERSGGLCKTPCPQRVDFDQRQISQSLFQRKMICAGGLISDPVKWPLVEPFNQCFVADFSVGELPSFAAGVGMNIQRHFGDVDADGLW